MENEVQIIDEKIAANRDHRVAMMTLVGSGESIAFVGAGLSVPLGYPSWGKLLRMLETEAGAVAPFVPTGGNELLRAQAAKDHFIKHGKLAVYLSLLGREFGPREKNCTDTHRRLVKLPFRAFVTTNYEDCVETALLQHSDEERRSAGAEIIIKAGDEDRHRVSLFLRSMTEPLGRRLVGHLHGRHSDTLSIVLAQGDYDAAYGSAQAGHKTTLHRHLVWALFATRRLVFIGCSLDDPPIRELLELVATGLWETMTSTMHYVILPLDQKSLDSAESTEAFFKRFGVQVVYYDNLNGNHSTLDTLLDEALARVGTGNSKSPAQLPYTSHTQSPKSAPADFGWLSKVSKDNLPEPKP